ncbi:MAG: hypothetical protein ABEJ07_03045 [Candidatus Nanohaloarchaea archaeon]
MNSESNVDIRSGLSGEDASRPVEILLDNDRQSQLHAIRRTYRVARNGSVYPVLEYCRGRDRLHIVDTEDEKVRKIVEFDSREEAVSSFQNYSNFSS